MPRSRPRSRRRVYRVQKYSSETVTGNIKATAISLDNTFALPIITTAGASGMRKAKNFSLKIVNMTTAVLYYALIYKPEGIAPGNINIPEYTTANLPDDFQPSSFYEPNQNVILYGCIEPTTSTSNPSTAITRTRLARNLNSMDTVALLVRPYGATLDGSTGISYVCNYAITY